MQENPILSVLKLVVLTAFTIFLGLNFFQYQSLEKKTMETHNEVDNLVSGVAEVGRSMSEAERGLGELGRRVERLEANVDIANKLIDKMSAIGVGTRGPAAPPTDEPTRTKRNDPDPAEGERKPSVINGKTLYPRTPGWTVVADATANEDRSQYLPDPDRIDWDATLSAYLAGEPKGLNPYSDDRTSVVVALNQYTLEPLCSVMRKDNLQWNADLAERVEESPDHTRYMIWLRKGIRWHDPEPAMLAKYPWLRERRNVTAHDVKFVVEIIRDPNAGSPLRYLYENLDEVIVHDDYRLEYVWKNEDYYNRAFTLDTNPIPKHIWGCDPDGNPYEAENVAAQFSKHWFGKSICGNGPYRFVEYKRGEYIKFQRHEGYYGQRATCKDLYRIIIKDPQAQLAACWNERIIYTQLPMPQYRQLVLEGDETRPLWLFEDRDAPPPAAWDFTYFLWRRPTYGGFGWNQRKPIFSDARVRRALTHALNRGDIIDKVFYGLGEQIPVGQSVFSPYFPDHLEPLAFDLDRAATLLDEAGWKDTDGDGIRDKLIGGQKTDLEFGLLISSSSPTQLQIVQIYKNDLLKIGVKLNPDPAESALWSRRIHDREFDGFIIFWTAGLDSSPRQLWASKYADDTGSNNYTGFRNAEADTIFDALHKEFDPEKRIELYHRWYEIQYEENPYTWIWSVKSPILINGDWRLPAPQLPNPKIDLRLAFRWKSR